MVSFPNPSAGDVAVGVEDAGEHTERDADHGAPVVDVPIVDRAGSHARSATWEMPRHSDGGS